MIVWNGQQIIQTGLLLVLAGALVITRRYFYLRKEFVAE
jgi:hypothetical protein